MLTIFTLLGKSVNLVNQWNCKQLQFLMATTNFKTTQWEPTA